MLGAIKRSILLKSFVRGVRMRTRIEESGKVRGGDGEAIPRCVCWGAIKRSILLKSFVRGFRRKCPGESRGVPFRSLHLPQLAMSLSSCDITALV